MDEGQNFAVGTGNLGVQPLFGAGPGLADEEHQVLGEPWVDTLIGPYSPPEGVQPYIPAVPKLLRPVLRPLLVDVVDPSLVGDGSGKQNGVTKGGDISDELVGRGGRELLCHLEAQNDIEASFDRKGPTEVG
jgi:hypothetical protein